MKRIIREQGRFYIEVLSKELFRGEPTPTPERWIKVDRHGWPSDLQNDPVSFKDQGLAEIFVDMIEIKAQPREVVKIYP